MDFISLLASDNTGQAWCLDIYGRNNKRRVEGRTWLI